jgi:hypothetical protein
MAPTLDDEVLLDLFAAIGERRAATIYFNNDKDGALNSQLSAVPLRIMASVENGRRCVAMMEGGILMFRELETIHRVERHGVSPEFFKYREKLDNYLRKCWSSDYERDIDTGKLKKAERVQMRLAIDSGDDMRILRRLLSEGRNGTVSVEIPGVYVYRNELWDAREILAFVFSFIGHILSFKSDNEEAAQIFRENIEKMSAMYGVSLDVETEGSDD